LHPYIGDRPVEIVRKVVYTFQARIADRWRNGRVFLLGDAAHLTPPYAGQGLNSGQRDANNFAWKAAAVVQGQFGLSLMDTYESERRAHAWSLIRMAIQIGLVMVPRNWFHTYGQIAFFRFTGLIPKLRDYFLGMKFKPEPRFEDGFLIADGETAKRTLVGRMLPQPDVETRDGGSMKLDDLLGTGFALLAIGGDAAIAIENSDNPLWHHLNAVRVALVPGHVNVPNIARKAIIADADLPQKLKPYRGKFLLVRPDRYVASSFTLEGASVAVDALAAQIGIKMQAPG
jgi:3-(3-hydroxy-phenyl)propionate hydroxylase